MVIGAYENIVKEQIKKIVKASKKNLLEDSTKAKMAEIWVREKTDIEKMSALFGFGYGAAVSDIMDAMKFSKEAKEEVIAAIKEKEE